MSGGSGAGRVIIGIFLMVFGVCFALAGGGCTVLLLVNLSSVGSDSLPLLALSFGALAVGIVLVRGAIKLFAPDE